VIQAWDTASKDKVSNDYSACVTLGLGVDGFIYVLDVHLEKYTVAQLIGARGQPGVIEQMWRLFATNGLPPSEVVIEDADSGVAALQLLAAQTSLPLVAAMAKKSSKEDRARAAASFYKGLRVLHPEGAAWVPGFERRLARFPNGSDHDDDIDALGHGLLHIDMVPRALVRTYDMDSVRVRLDGGVHALPSPRGDESMGMVEDGVTIMPVGRL
jgi:predicted phage terminase large subunit-like protein